MTTCSFNGRPLVAILAEDPAAFGAPEDYWNAMRRYRLRAGGAYLPAHNGAPGDKKHPLGACRGFRATVVREVVVQRRPRRQGQLSVSGEAAAV